MTMSMKDEQLHRQHKSIGRTVVLDCIRFCFGTCTLSVYICKSIKKLQPNQLYVELLNTMNLIN